MAISWNDRMMPPPPPGDRAEKAHEGPAEPVVARGNSTLASSARSRVRWPRPSTRSTRCCTAPGSARRHRARALPERHSVIPPTRDEDAPHRRCLGASATLVFIHSSSGSPDQNAAVEGRGHSPSRGDTWQAW